MKLVRNLIILASLFLVGCSGIKMISPGMEDLYTDKFKNDIELIKKDFASGRKEVALKKLSAMDEKTLLPSERAMKRNLAGVILFSQGEYEKSIFEFNLALASSNSDVRLTSKIYLNLASSYFKLSDIEKAYSSIRKSEFSFLEGKEFQNYHLLRLALAKELAKSDVALESLIYLFKDKPDAMSLKAESNFNDLVSMYFSMGESERLRLIQQFANDQVFTAGYLAYLDAQNMIAMGRMSDSDDLISWINDAFEDNQNLLNLVATLKTEFKDVSAINTGVVGVILPLSGKKGEFGKRALKGIDFAIRRLNKQFKANGVDLNVKLVVKDSEGSSVLGAERVKNLIEKDKVSVVIGGLYTDEAVSQFLESKKYRTLFISLSQVHVEKVLKDHLLIEVPGSIESQISLLFSDKFLDFFGRKAGIVYPNDEKGRSYLDEFWKLAEMKSVKVNTVSSYDKTKNDHTDTISKVLGLKFKRERQEELELLREVHKLEGKTSIRRIQTLKPEINFDWIFIPSIPSEAQQIIPTFSYFDAFNLPIVGPPSWRSRSLLKQSRKYGKLYFLASKIPSLSSSFANDYKESYGTNPKLVEMMGIDAVTLIGKVFSLGKYSERSELDKALATEQFLDGVSGSWIKDSGLWLKTMQIMTLYRGRISKLDMTIKREIEEKAEFSEDEVTEEAKENEDL